MMKKAHGGREKQKPHVDIDACVGVPGEREESCKERFQWRCMYMEEEDSRVGGCVAMATHW